MKTRFLNETLGTAGLVDFKNKKAEVWDALPNTDFSNQFQPLPDQSFKPAPYMPEPPEMPEPPRIPEFLDLDNSVDRNLFEFKAGLQGVAHSSQEKILQDREAFAIDIERAKPKSLP